MGNCPVWGQVCVVFEGQTKYKSPSCSSGQIPLCEGFIIHTLTIIFQEQHCMMSICKDGYS